MKMMMRKRGKIKVGMFIEKILKNLSSDVHLLV
jgi:hypothetical protein